MYSILDFKGNLYCVCIVVFEFASNKAICMSNVLFPFPFSIIQSWVTASLWILDWEPHGSSAVFMMILGRIVAICINQNLSWQATNMESNLWQAPIGKPAVPHWASMLRWIWSISECNLKTRDSRKQTPKGGLLKWERRGSGPEKQ